LLTTSSDFFVGVAGGDDAFTGTQATLGSDIIVDGSTADTDTLTIASTGTTSTATATIVGIENVVVNNTSFGTATLNATGIKTGTVTVNQLQSGSTGVATVNGAVNSLTINAGSGVKGTFTVDNIVAGSTVVVNGNALVTTIATTTAGADGSIAIVGGALTASISAIGDIINITAPKTAAAIAIDGVTAADAAATVVIGQSATITNGAATSVNTLDVSSSFAATTTATATATIANAGPTTSLNISGSNDLIVGGSSAFFTGKTVTDSSTATSTLKLTTVATADLSKAAVDVIDVAATAAAAATISVNDDKVVKLSADTVAAGLTIDADDDATNSASSYLSGTVTINLAADDIDGGSLTVDASGASDDGFDTVNLIVSNDQNGTGLDLITASTTAVTASGSKELVLTATSTAASLDASAMTGDVTVNYDNTSDILSVTTGSGADTFTNATAAIATRVTISSGAGEDAFTMLTAAKATIDAGDDYDTVNLVGDISNLVLTNVEELATTGNVTSAKTSQLSGLTYIVSGANAFTFGTAASNFDTSSIDLSGLTINGVTGFTVNAGNGLSTALYTSTTGATITGSSVADALSGTANADVISGGAGIDTINGNAGDDTITGGEAGDLIDGGAGKDTIILTETTAASDTVSFTAAVTADTTAYADTISGFKTTSDKLSFDAITVAGGGAIAATSGTAVTAGGVTAGALTDDLVYVINNGATALTAAGTQAIADYTDLTDVAAYLNEGYTATADNDAAIFVINDLVNDLTYVYLFDEQTAGASTIQKADLSLIGIVTEVAGAALVSGDIA
jgi:hypothetical protein